MVAVAASVGCVTINHSFFHCRTHPLDYFQLSYGDVAYLEGLSFGSLKKAGFAAAETVAESHVGIVSMDELPRR